MYKLLFCFDIPSTSSIWDPDLTLISSYKKKGFNVTSFYRNFRWIRYKQTLYGFIMDLDIFS